MQILFEAPLKCFAMNDEGKKIDRENISDVVQQNFVSLYDPNQVNEPKTTGSNEEKGVRESDAEIDSTEDILSTWMEIQIEMCHHHAYMYQTLTLSASRHNIVSSK